MRISGLSGLFDLWCCCCLLFVFETGSYCVAQAGLERIILLPKPPKWMLRRMVLIITAVGKHASGHMWRSEDHLQELILSFHHVKVFVHLCVLQASWFLNLWAIPLCLLPVTS